MTTTGPATSRSSTCPDLDSIEREHRERVEAMLPRVDAVVWVTDPEKYHDAILHDDFLGRVAARLDRQVVVLNKTDRLSADDAERVRHDLERDLARMAGGGGRGPRVRVLLASARAPRRLGRPVAMVMSASSSCASGWPVPSRRNASFAPAS